MVKILGIRVDDHAKSAVLKKVNGWLEGEKSRIFTIVTPNPEVIVQAQDDTKLSEILNSADLAVPDGVGLRFAGVKNTVHGIELLRRLCRLAAEKGWSVGFYGGRKGAAEEGLAKLKQAYPGLRGWARTAPEFSLSKSRSYLLTGFRQQVGWITAKIEETSTKLLFIGLGVPKQEYFIQLLREKLPITDYRLPITLMGVGGSFDEIAGKIRPAPGWVGSLGLKWLWRLFWQPWRIKRQMRLVKFVILILARNFNDRYE